MAGDADLLVVPDILCGNMLIKGIGYFGDAKDASLVLGLEVPVLFGSRGGPIEGNTALWLWRRSMLTYI